MGVTQELADALRAGMDAARDKANSERLKLRIPRLVNDREMLKAYEIKNFSAEAVYGRLKRLPQDSDTTGGITESDVRDLCRFMNDTGLAPEAAKECFKIWEERYKPFIPMMQDDKRKRAIQYLDASLRRVGYTRRDIAQPDERAAVLNALVQSPVRNGNSSQVFSNISLLLALGNGDHFGHSTNQRLELMGDITIVARHALYRMGYFDEEREFADRIEKLRDDAERKSMARKKLAANHLAYIHTRDMRGGASLAALAALRDERNISVAGLGAGRLLVYAAESCIYRGSGLTDAPSGLDMSVIEAIKKSFAIAMANGDLDGAIRCRIVIVRAKLWRGDWHDALEELADIWQRVTDLRARVPQAEMLLHYMEYVSYLFAAKDGMDGAQQSAELAHRQATHMSITSRAPILSPGHKTEFSLLAEARGIVLDLGT